MKASAYLQLPEKLKNSKYILNIQNEDDKCAQWCIIAHLFPKYENNRTRRIRKNINAYRHHEKDINTTGIQFPLKIQDVSKLEELNDLSINIFSIDGKVNIIPIRISERRNVNEQRNIDLLYIVNEMSSRYCAV